MGLYDFLQTNITVIMIIVGIVSVIIVIFIVVAIYSGREVCIWPPQIGPKIDKTQNLKDDATNFQHDHISINRKKIHWEPLNDKIAYKYWACGTSLIGVAENDLITRFWQKNIREIKIILPKTQRFFISYWQLHQYDILDTSLVYGQVDAAKESKRSLSKSIKKLGIQISDHLREYGGIMWYNITIYDDDAYISFYDVKGIGDTNITLHFNKKEYPIEYTNVEDKFMELWNSSPNFGQLAITKPKGASIIFVNHNREILLFLRDNIPSIPYPNKWDILGGHVEDNESPEECIIREMKEEIGIDIIMPNLFKIADMIDRIEHTFWLMSDLDLAKIVLNEGQRLKWFTHHELMNLPSDQIAFNFKQTIIEFLREKPFDK